MAKLPEITDYPEDQTANFIKHINRIKQLEKIKEAAKWYMECHLMYQWLMVENIAYGTRLDAMIELTECGLVPAYRKLAKLLEIE